MLKQEMNRAKTAFSRVNSERRKDFAGNSFSFRLISLPDFTAFSLFLTILEYVTDGNKRAAVAAKIFFKYVSTKFSILTFQRRSRSPV
jgi:hypothetical protein